FGFRVYLASALLVLPISDRTLCPGRSRRADVVGIRIMFAGTFVEVVLIPRILGDTFQVGSMPAGDIPRLYKNVVEDVTALRVEPGIHFKCVEGGFEIRDLGLRRRDTGLFAASHHLWINNGGESRQNDQDEQHFNQGKAAATAWFHCTVLGDASIHI